MKSYATYAFNSEGQQPGEVTTTASLEGVTLTNKIGARWNVENQSEETAATFHLHLTVEDAKELAANLLKSAAFAEEAEKFQPASIRRGRY